MSELWRSLNVIAAIWQVIYHFHLVVCSNNDIILNHYRDIMTSAVYKIACNLEKSFSFDNKVEVRRHMHFPIHV